MTREEEIRKALRGDQYGPDIPIDKVAEWLCDLLALLDEARRTSIRCLNDLSEQCGICKEPATVHRCKRCYDLMQESRSELCTQAIEAEKQRDEARKRIAVLEEAMKNGWDRTDRIDKETKETIESLTKELDEARRERDEARHTIAHLKAVLEEEGIDSSAIEQGECVFEVQCARLEAALREAREQLTTLDGRPVERFMNKAVEIIDAALSGETGEKHA